MTRPRSMKRIAFIMPSYLPANLPGSGTFIMALAERLADEENEVTVITSDALNARSWYAPIFGKAIFKKRDKIHGVHVIRLSSNWVKSSIYYILFRITRLFGLKEYEEIYRICSSGPILIGLNKQLEQGKFDVVHCSPFPMYLNCQLLNVLQKLSYHPQLVLTPFYHGEINEFKNKLLVKVAQYADIIHVISDSEKDDITRFLRVNRNRISKIPLSIDLSSYSSHEAVESKKSELIKKYDLGAKIVILFAGNKGHLKGAIHLLHVMHQLHNMNPKYVLVAIGNKTHEWICELKKIDNMCILDLPYQRGVDKEAWFSTAQVLAMPSISESFGLVYLESWLQKKPVIGAAIPAVVELIRNNTAGLLIPFGNCKKLMTAIKELTTNTKLARNLGYNGYKALIDKYTFEKNYKKYKKLFIKNKQN